MAEEALARVETKVDHLGTKVSALETTVDQLDGKLDHLGRDMRLLHEDLVGKIADLAPDFEPIERAFKKADAELRESIEQGLQPLESAVRSRRRLK